MAAVSPTGKTSLRFARLTTWVADSRPGGAFLAVVAGAVAGAIAILTVRLAMGITDLVAASRSGLLILILPVVAGVIVSAIRWRLPATTTGVEPFLAGHTPRLVSAVVTAFLGLLTASFVGVVGREEPAIGLAGYVASRLRWLQRSLSARGLVACAFAGGIGMVLGAPFAVLAFVLETMAGRIAAVEVLPVAAAAFLGSAFSPAPVPPGPVFTPAEPLGWAILLGVVIIAAMLSLALPSSLGLVADTVRRSHVATLITPPLVGLVAGGIAYLAPGLLSVETPGGIEGALIALGLFVLLVLILGSGGAGGVLVPALGLALALGGVLATLLESVDPTVVPSVVTVCMAVMLAGAFRAPLAGAAIAFVAGGDAMAITALAGACLLVGALSRQLEPRTALDAIQWDQSRTETAAATTRVIDVMEPVDPVSLQATLVEIASLPEDRPVVDRSGKFLGMIGPVDAERARLLGDESIRVIDFVRQPGLIAWPYSTVADAFSQPDADREALLPVVSAVGRRVLGIVPSFGDFAVTSALLHDWCITI